MQLATLTAWIGKLVGVWRGQVYRPERHYMRGPGPKAQAGRPGPEKLAEPKNIHVKA